jgi:hypothetical protein
VELTSDPCVVVCSEEGRVLWHRRSRNFTYAIAGKGNTLSPSSIAAAIVRGEDGNDSGETVQPEAWITPRGLSLEVLESSILLPRLGHVLSLVHVVEDE